MVFVLNATIRPSNYGLLPDGSDCTAGLTQMFNDASLAGGGDIEMSPGQWTCASGISMPAVAGKINLKGRGKNNSAICFPNGGGLSFNYLDIHKPVDVSDLSILTGRTPGVFYGGVADASVGLAIMTPPVTGATLAAAPTTSFHAGPNCSNLLLGGYNPMTGAADVTRGWATAIAINEAWFPLLTDVVIIGVNVVFAPGPVFASQNGIICTNTQSPIIERPKVYWVQTAISYEGAEWNEGINIRGGDLVGVGYGVGDQSTFPRSGVSIADMHIDAYDICIVSSVRGQFSIHDCLFFASAPTTNWIGVYLMAGADGDIIHDNTFACPGVPAGATMLGILITDCPGTKVHDNQFSDFPVGPSSTGIMLQGNSLNCSITNNGTSSSGSPPTNLLKDNSRLAISNFVSGR